MEEKQIAKQVKILIGSAAWKESLTPVAANDIITKVLQKHRPHWQLITFPLSDGGDGWLEVASQLPIADNAQWESVEVTGPVPGQQLSARYLWSESTQTALVEAAEIHGMRRLPNGEKHPTTATSYGVGQAVSHLIHTHPQIKSLILSVGGSASVDGGMGFLQALGWQFFDQNDTPITTPIGGGLIGDIHRVTPPQTPLPCPPITVLVDVKTLYLDAPRIFGPQKGASPDEVAQMTQGFERILGHLEDATPLAKQPGTGAAGGLSLGVLLGCPGATIRTGMEWYTEATDLDTLWQQVDWVITGEGRLDKTSLLGKGTGYFIEKAVATHKPLIIFCGQNVLPVPLAPWIHVFPLYEPGTPINPQVIQQSPHDLEKTVEAAISTIL